MEKLEDVVFPSMDESLLNDIINFVHPKDRFVFKYNQNDDKIDLSNEEFKIQLINNEFVFANDDFQSFYKRIEKLTNLNSHLDKFLTESSDYRYNQFIDASFYQNFSDKFSETTNETLKIMRKNFDQYKNSTLYDFNKILYRYNLLNKLKNCIPFLYIYRDIYRINEFIKKLDIPIMYRILACGYGIQYCRNVVKTDPKVTGTLFFNLIKDNFSKNIDKFITNIFVKNQYRYDPCDKLLILIIFGQNNEKSCEYVINFLKDELISITSLNIQKYLNLDRDLVGYKSNGLSSRDIADQAALLSPNLSLLVVCKILSEFLLFFQTLTSKLKYESKIIYKNKNKNSLGFNHNINNQNKLNLLFNNLNKTDYYLYYRNCLDLFINKFVILIDTSFDILYKILNSFNFNSLKDQNDVLKIALLILYYTTLQQDIKKNCLNQNFDNNYNNIDNNNNNNTNNSNNKNINTKYKYIGIDKEIIEILNEFCNKNLKIYENLDQKNQLDNLLDNNTGYNKLQQVLCRILNDYTQKFTNEVIENISICLTNDTLQRLVLNPISFDNIEIDGYNKIFKKFISESEFIYFGHYKFINSNPFIGWTPNSNFVTINICSPILINYNNDLLNTKYNNNNFDNNNNTKTKSMDLNNSRLVRDYGGVYTITSREVLRSFEMYFKIIMVLETNCVEVIQYYTKLLDEFIYKNVKSCKMENCVIENLKKFNMVFDNEKMSIEISTGRTTCDTYRQDYFEEDKISDISRLYSVVNVVESCFTILESLLLIIKNNGNKNNKFCKYLTNYYNERIEIIVELRLMLYHIAIYNILRPKLPSINLLTSIKSTKPLHIDIDVNKTFKEFQNHLKSVKEIVESADSGSFPIMIKVFLWDSIINVIKESFKPLLNLINNNINSELEKNISNNYFETLKLSYEIRAKYVDQVRVDYKRYKTEIANMSTYYNLVEGMLNSLKN